MAITIDDLAADLQQFFAQKFPPGSGEGPGSVQLIFDALGTPLDPVEFVGSGTNSAQDILAHQRAAQLADQLPAANMLSAGWYVAKSGSRLSRWYENILSGSTALSSNPDDLKAFEALKQAALHRFAENKLVLVSGAAVGGSAGTVDAVGVHDSYYATSMSPIDWFQASATCWETYKSSAHDNQPIPIDTPPLSKRPTFALRVAVQDDNPALMKFLDRAVVSGLSVNEAISPAPQVEPIAAATPIARRAPMHMAERTISSAAIESIALTPQITNNMIIGQSIAVLTCPL